MVIVEPVIEDKLLEIFFEEFALNPNTPKYFAIKKELLRIDKEGYPRNTPYIPAWKRAKWFEVRVGDYLFAYIWDGETALLVDWEDNYPEAPIHNKKKMNETLKPLSNIEIINLMLAMDLDD